MVMTVVWDDDEKIAAIFMMDGQVMLLEGGIVVF